MHLRIGFYGMLAILGAVIPWYFNIQYMLATPGVFDPLHFVAQGMLNPASASLTVDLLLVGMAAFIFIALEAHRLGMKRAWFYIAWSFGIALASGLPLFLLMRERRLMQLNVHNDRNY